jgi:hypothetical protein
MLRRAALVRTDVSEELSASIIRVTRIGELGTTLAVTANRRISEDATLHSHRRKNLKSFRILVDGNYEKTNMTFSINNSFKHVMMDNLMKSCM